MHRLLPLLLVVACDSTTPAVARWPSARVEVEGTLFGVHWSDDRAEAYRLSGPSRPFRAVAARAAVAIADASGCAVEEVGGDPSIVTARLDCGGGGPRRPQLRVTPGDCAPGPTWRNDGLGTETTALDCDLRVRWAV
jgi:hypothetical protein